MKVLLFNVKFSENLGDGILAQCLEQALMRNGEIEVETIDLAGREKFGSTSYRPMVLRFLHFLPPIVRKMIVRIALRSKLKALASKWEQRIADADAVVLGGGNLFQDDDLNFPLKVGTLLQCVATSGKPLAIYGVGVSKNWSTAATRLFGRIDKTKLAHLSVRDGNAAACWSAHFPYGPSPQVVPDPGLLACERYVSSIAAEGDIEQTVGICVTDPFILKRHADARASAIPFCTREDYVDLIERLVIQGYRVRLFTNGAREDQVFAEYIFKSEALAPLRAIGALELMPRPQDTDGLIGILKSTSVILAHRLHSCIAAYSLGIAHVGLGWDQKVASFFHAVGRSAYFIDDRSASPQLVTSLLIEAQKAGIDGHCREKVVRSASEAVSEMGRRLVLSQRLNRIEQRI